MQSNLVRQLNFWRYVMTNQGNTTTGDVAEFGSVLFAAERADVFGQFLFKDDVFGERASSFITEYCARALERLRSYSRAAQEQCKGSEVALIHLAGKLKYVNAHLDLAIVYGKHIGIMSEHQQFRLHALTYISLVHAELEALEYFDPEHLV